MIKNRVVPYTPLLVLLVLLFTSPSLATEDTYLLELQAEVREKRLWEQRQWHVLMHYKQRMLKPGVKSQVDSESFFLAPDGKTNPQSELEATLASFFAPYAETNEEHHPQCVFIARYHWMKQELNFDSKRLPQHHCSRFNNWMAKLDPDQITLIFPMAFLNNPASMFGHTLLRIDAPTQNEHTRLLAYTLGFAAHTQQERGLPFALKGLFGGYPGRFSIAPYYLRVKEYGDIENRDIWEYNLGLTPTEVRRMLMHVWELRSAHFDYYFLDENCSYHLLSMLEVARPSLHLTDRFKWWAIPADTIRTVTEAPNLLNGVKFRPARRTILYERTRQMENKLQEIAKGVGEGGILADSETLRKLPPFDQARVLELAIDYEAYLRASEKVVQKEGESSPMPMLVARSRLDVPPQTPHITAPDVRPDQGHKSTRIGISYGCEDSQHFFQLEGRPAYHDLLDPSDGFIRGAQIEFLDAAVRYWPRKNRVALERLNFINIVSVPPRDRFIQSFSWKANVGLVRMNFSDDDRPLTGHGNAGVGVSYDLPFEVMVYAFAEGEAVISDHFDEKLALGAGPSLGILFDISEWWHIGFSARLLAFTLGATSSAHDIDLTQCWDISPQSALRLKLSRKREFGSSFSTVVLSWQVYF